MNTPDMSSWQIEIESLKNEKLSFSELKKVGRQGASRSIFEDKVVKNRKTRKN